MKGFKGIMVLCDERGNVLAKPNDKVEITTHTNGAFIGILENVDEEYEQVNVSGARISFSKIKTIKVVEERLI